MAASSSCRRLRAFKRWMIHHDIDCSDALLLAAPTVAASMVEEQCDGISVRAVCDLHEGDIVASIPKNACLTIKTSGAMDLIESQGLDGYLGLSVALMYERSLVEESPWFGYLQLLPEREDGLPLVWTLDEVDSLLRGTELHKTVQEDKALVYEDWKECILPLMEVDSLKIDPKFFAVEQYFAAKSLIASRSFQIDKFHGFGMVPLADLFNHKTGAEDVHFTAVSSHCESENVDEDIDEDTELHDEEIQKPHLESESLTVPEDSSTSEDDPLVLEMIMVKDVKAGSEVFNTYGLMGNAALLHRYGFTELNNPYDIVNIDVELVVQWSLSLFSSRHSRSRLALWRKLDCPGCVSQNSEYFEISYDGEPQADLLFLLYIVLLPEEVFHKLDITLSAAAANFDLSMVINWLSKSSHTLEEASEMNKDLFLTRSVCDALLSLADIRESIYGSNLEDDAGALKNCCRLKDKKLYHSLVLRLSERSIIKKLRMFAISSREGTPLNRASLRNTRAGK